MSEKSSLVVTIPRNSFITSIEIRHNTSEAWGYDPAIETYDLYNENQNIQDNNLANAGLILDYDDYEAKFLTNLTSGLALNNRIAISQVEYNGVFTPWQLDHGLKSLYNWHNISICNLVEGDRVVIYYTGSIKFSSKAENMAYNGCAAFKDIENNGDFDEGDDAEIALGMSVDAKESRWENNLNTTYYTSYPYVITEDGHLDLALSADSRICKIEIYGDHQAQMVDKDNLHDTNTSYFNTTGQLEAKHHIVPGGLHVYIGNDNLAQHAEVVRSDKGPVSFVYDQEHKKMARTATFGNFNVTSELPATGTFYKFVPEVSGKMWVKFKAASINYRDYGKAGNVAINSDGTPNEVTNNANCPYYLMVDNNGTPQQIERHDYGNGADGFFGTPKGNPGPDLADGITVEKGKTYYLYGWWDDTNDAFGWQNGHACGVAELLEVTFRPNNVVTPLAKWVESGTKNDDNLARVRGYNTVFVKKKSDNIASCEPYIEGDRLKIRNITFVDENKGGGTILVKIGDRNDDAAPVFVYTIAYNAGYNPQTLGQDASGNDLTRSEGHTWNFSDNPLKGLEWTDKNAEAVAKDFGTHFNNFATATKDENGIPTNGTKSGLLTTEINKGDWTFNYRVKKNNTFMDPRFLNNYDMEGDNADMMWDTEGIIINAGSTQSCIFNEHGTTVDHGLTNKIPNQIADPDRYVGFLKGGQFIIPKLKKDDRVIVYMGSGNGSGNQAMEFHITNARDALYNEIDPTDTYHAGGSQWNVPNGHNDPYYRGCYHFYAKEDGDMVFEMSGGSMCKLYSIKIYRGEREETNGIQEAGNGYTILAEKDQDGNVITSETNTWNLHYRGKGETLADGTGKNSQKNEIIAHSGNITNLELGNPNNATISYTNIGEIGMLRARVKCMEYNHNYVTDYSDRNFTLALHETQSYPYTWDFTDIDVYSGADIEAEDTNYPETTISYEEKGYDLSVWDEDGKMILYGPTWGYTNQNMLFENSKGINGNQLYANGKVIPETQGLWFYFDNNDVTYNGSMQITEDGLDLCNYKEGLRRGWWNYKMVVPSVPSGAAVYLRVAKDSRVADDTKDTDGTTYFQYKTFRFDSHMPTYPTWNAKNNRWELKYVKYDIGSTPREDNETSATWDACTINKVNWQAGSYSYDSSIEKYSKFFEAEDGSGDYIMAIYNWGEESNLILTLNGWIVKKMGVSLDEKKIGATGYATESRGRVIDHRLTSFFTGKPVEAYIGKMNSGHTLLQLTQIDIMDKDNDPTNPADASHLGKGCILYNNAGESVTDKSVSVFDDGTFNLFVPDMHLKDEDTKNTTSSNGSYVFSTNFAQDNDLKACVPVIHLDNNSTSFTRYILSAQPYKYQEGEDDGGSASGRPKTEDGKLIGFYRVNPKTGSNMKGNQAYIEVSNSATARVDITFDMFEDIDDGVATKVEGVENAGEGNGSYMTISGQRVNTPAQSGIYIKNGKKIVVK